MSAVDQIPPLLGVAVGAVTSYLATSAAERTRWRRLQEARWDERRLAAYVDYGNAVKEIVAIANRLAAARGLTGGAKPQVPDEVELAHLVEAEARRTVLRETVRLLGDKDTARAAREMTIAAWDLARLVRDGAQDSTTWADAYWKYAVSRDAYMECCRRNLRVSGEIVPSDFHVHRPDAPAKDG